MYIVRNAPENLDFIRLFGCVFVTHQKKKIEIVFYCQYITWGSIGWLFDAVSGVCFERSAGLIFAQIFRRMNRQENSVFRRQTFFLFLLGIDFMDFGKENLL